MSAFDKWPFTNKGNPFDTDEWRDAMEAARTAGEGMIFQTSGDANVGVQVGNVTGGIVFGGGQSVVGGSITKDGVTKTCNVCGGTRGWVIQDDMEIHTGNGCGAKQ